MRIKVQIVMAINNTSQERTVRTDEFILDDNNLVFPEVHKQPIEALINNGYSIESISIMNETQSRVLSFNAIPTSIMFKGFDTEQLYDVIEKHLTLLKELL